VRILPVSKNEGFPQGEYAFSRVDPAAICCRSRPQGFKKTEKKGIVVATRQFNIKVEVG